MVAAVDEHGAREGDLERVDEEEDLAVVLAAVDEVAVEEEDIERPGPAGAAEDERQVGQLPVQVADQHQAAALGHRHPLQRLVRLEHGQHGLQQQLNVAVVQGVARVRGLQQALGKGQVEGLSALGGHCTTVQGGDHTARRVRLRRHWRS